MWTKEKFWKEFSVQVGQRVVEYDNMLEREFGRGTVVAIDPDGNPWCQVLLDKSDYNGETLVWHNIGDVRKISAPRLAIVEKDTK